MTLIQPFRCHLLNEYLPHARQSVVECIDLSEFIVSLRSRIRPLKIDIEGAELPVIHRLIDLAVVETHEIQQPLLLRETDALRHRIKSAGYADKFRLDWI